MKKILTFLFLLPCFCAFAQHGISQDSLEKRNLAKTLNDPGYKKVVADVAEVRKNILLAHKGQLKSDYVVKDYNTRLGAHLGPRQTLAKVEERMDAVGDKFIKYTLLTTSSRIALEDAKIMADSAARLQNRSN